MMQGVKVIMGGTLSDTWIDTSLALLKGKLGVFGDGTRSEAWRDAMGNMDPAEYYQKLTRDLPGNVEVMIESKGAGSSEINLNCKYGPTKLLEVENHIHRAASQREIRFEEWKVGSETNRGHGLGTILFANQLELMGPLGLENINLRAGRTDGPVYWARRGARIREDGPYLRDFTKIVAENYNAIRSQINPETCARIDEILSNPTPYANVQLARIEVSIESQQIYRLLLQGTNPRCTIKTSDELQMGMVRHYLGNIGAIHTHVQEDFPRITRNDPSIPKSLATKITQPPPSGFSNDFKH